MRQGEQPGVPQPRLVAVDWGRTSLRAWLLGDEARILDSRRRARGLQGTASDDRNVQATAYQRVFDEAVGDWLRPTRRCRSSGAGGLHTDLCRISTAAGRHSRS
jgi:hypothetical protein